MIQSKASKKVSNRIKSAVEVGGVTLTTIAKRTGITYFRVASVVNTESYRQATSFTDEEVSEINKVLDAIKKAI